MAKKTSEGQQAAPSSTAKKKTRRTPRRSRKVLAKAEAPYERKADGDSDEEPEKKPAGDDSSAPEATAAGAKADADEKPSSSLRSSAKASTTKTKSAKSKDSDEADSEPAKTTTRSSDKRSKKASAPAEAETKAEAPASPAAADKSDNRVADKSDNSVADKSDNRVADKTTDTTTQSTAADADVDASTAVQGTASELKAAGGYDPAPNFDPGAQYADLLPPGAIGNWDPNAEAPPPAKAPPGDSRSFRRHGPEGPEFMLIYRSDAFLITRTGLVGRLGAFTITEYPHVGAAAHAYAQECSELAHAGYRDLR